MSEFKKYCLNCSAELEEDNNTDFCDKICEEEYFDELDELEEIEEEDLEY